MQRVLVLSGKNPRHLARARTRLRGENISKYCPFTIPLHNIKQGSTKINVIKFDHGSRPMCGVTKVEFSRTAYVVVASEPPYTGHAQTRTSGFLTLQQKRTSSNG